jgi:hypothetical protein
MKPAPRVLLFAHRDQRRSIGTFDADEDSDEIGALHQHQKLGIVGEIERGFGGELERIIARFEPRCEFRQKRLDGLFVADEVVVDEVDMAAIAEAIERVELGKHLRVGLGARHPPVKLDDVAKLAGERAAARELHADVEIVVEFQQIEARDRRLGHVDLKFLRLELSFARARFPGFDEFADDVLGFAEDAKVGRLIEMGKRRDAGAADGDGFAVGAAEIDDVERVALLRHHPAGEDQIGPAQVVVAQFLGVAIDQPQRPGRRQQRRKRYQAERWRRIFGAEDFSGPGEIPKGVRIETRVDQKRVARFCTRRVFHPRPPSVGGSR